MQKRGAMLLGMHLKLGFARLGLVLVLGSGCDVEGGEAGEGGEADDGALDCPALSPGEWSPTTVEGAPEPTEVRHTAWNGQELLVFGDEEGGAYDPCADAWTTIDMADAPPELAANAMVDGIVGVGRTVTFLWMGAIGVSSPYESSLTGVSYDPDAAAWHTLPLGGDAPAPRMAAVIAAVGDRIVVWGGKTKKDVELGAIAVARGDGAMLDPTTGTWTAIASTGAPSPRAEASWAWTGQELVIWGGVHDPSSPYGPLCDPEYDCGPLGDGARFDPAANAWQPISTNGAPSPRSGAKLLWTGDRVVVWGGADLESARGDGAIYDPAADAWSPMAALAPLPAALDGWQDAYVDGGRIVVVRAPDAWIYDLATDAWTEVDTSNPPDRTGYGGIIHGDDRRMVIAVPNPADPDLEALASISVIDASTARWTKAVLPAELRPALFGASLAWAGDRLVAWGGYRDVPDPSGNDGCNDVSPIGCDPETPTQRVYEEVGGVIVPELAP